MKRTALLLAMLAVAGVIAFAVCYRMAIRPLRALPAGVPTELAWLGAEFRLDEATFAKVRALHDAYEPRCMENCGKISRVNDRIATLVTSGSASAVEMDAALAEAAQLQRECRGDMWRHVESVAAVLSPDKAQRYRAMMARAIVQPGLPHEPAHPH